MHYQDSDCLTIVSRHSLFDIAGELECTASHLGAMLDMARERLSRIDGGQPRLATMEHVEAAQSLLDAAQLYLEKITLANDQLYRQARTMPVELKIA